MKKIDTGVACMELDSIAIGYRMLSVVSAVSGVSILDASPCGSKFFILMSGEKSKLDDAIREARHLLDGIRAESWVDSEVFDLKNRDVLEALFALPQTPIDESLVVVECDTICGCLAVAHTLVDGHGLKPIEIRLLRSSTGAAYGFFTGKARRCGPAAEDARAKLRAAVRNGRVEVIDNPPKAFRAFFETTGTD